MVPALEVAIFPLQSGSDVSNPSSEVGSIWRQILDVVVKQDGLVKIWWGPQVESPDSVQLCAAWTDISKHEAFQKSAEYGPMVKRLESVSSGPFTMFHVPLDQTALNVPLSAGATEIVSAYVAPSNVDNFDSASKKFVELCMKDEKAPLGSAGAWQIEEAEHKSFEAEGGKGKKYWLVLGWPSVEAHMAFRETQTFKDAIGLLRDNIKGIEMHHVHFQTV